MFKIIIALAFFFIQTYGINSFESETFMPDQQHSPSITNYPAFIKIGSFRGLTDNGLEYQKSYYLPRFFKANWGEAKGLCSSFGLELTTVETRQEAEIFLNIVENHQSIKALGSTYILVDGITSIGKSTTEWFWSKSGNKVSFSLPWKAGQPDFYLNNEYCLSVGILGQQFGFNDCPCWDYPKPFICQRFDFMMS